MKTILSIGYNHYVLPASANVNVILKALTGAQEVDDKWHDGEYYFHPKGAAKLSVRIVDNRFVVDGKRKMIPESCGPEGLGE